MFECEFGLFDCFGRMSWFANRGFNPSQTVQDVAKIVTLGKQLLHLLRRIALQNGSTSVELTDERFGKMVVVTW